MLKVAAEKRNVQASLTVADACALPLRSEKFEGVTIGWGLRNVPSVESALLEIFRVLKPNGRFVSLDMARPKGAFGAFSEKVFHSVVPLLGGLFGKREAYTYLPKSTVRFLSPQDLAHTLAELGFEDVWFKPLFFGNIGMVGGKKP